MNVGSRIRELRLNRKLRMVELADKSFISQSFLSDIERNKTQPSLETLFSICHALDISVGDFFGGQPGSSSIEDLSAVEQNIIDLLSKLPPNEKRALFLYLNERLKN